MRIIIIIKSVLDNVNTEAKSLSGTTDQLMNSMGGSQFRTTLDKNIKKNE